MYKDIIDPPGSSLGTKEKKIKQKKFNKKNSSVFRNGIRSESHGQVTLLLALDLKQIRACCNCIEAEIGLSRVY